MWLRRAFFHWLPISALVLPLWLLIGWIVSDAGGWALAWVLIFAIPSVLLGQLVLTFLVRARGTVRHSRSVSWWDVAGIALWHVLTIAVGTFVEGWFWALLTLAIVAFLAVFWSSLRQLLREAAPSEVLRRYSSPSRDGSTPPVVIIEERREAE